MGSWFITSHRRFAASENTPLPNSLVLPKMSFSARHSLPSSRPAAGTLPMPGEKFVSAIARISALISTLRCDDTKCTLPFSFSSVSRSLCVRSNSSSASLVSCESLSTTRSNPPSSRNAAAAALA